MPRTIMNRVGSLFLIVFACLATFASALAQDKPPGLGIPCLGTVPFDPELARQCDLGSPLAELPTTPVGRALQHVAQQLLDSLDSTRPAAAPVSNELRRDREPSR